MDTGKLYNRLRQPIKYRGQLTVGDAVYKEASSFPLMVTKVIGKLGRAKRDTKIYNLSFDKNNGWEWSTLSPYEEIREFGTYDATYGSYWLADDEASAGTRRYTPPPQVQATWGRR